MSESQARRLHPRPLLALLAVLLCLCLPLMLTTRETNYTADESTYYLPAVQHLRGTWPHLDLASDSLSATAPGYAYALAGISHLTGSSRLTLRLVNFAISAGVVVLLCTFWPATVGSRTVFAGVLPFVASNFFVKSASCVVTDNAALLLIGIVLCSLFSQAGKFGMHAAALCAAGAVLVRQSSAWLLAPLMSRIWCDLSIRRRLASWLLPLPAVVIILLLLHSWGGLVPPEWQSVHQPRQGPAFAAGAYLFALLAVLGSAYYAAIRIEEWKRDLLSPLALIGAAAGLGLALAQSNLPDYASGRWGGYLWTIGAHLPAIGNYSVLFLVLAPTGGAVFGMLVRSLWQEAGTLTANIWFVAFVAWAMTGLVNRQVFHRYFEPMMLVMLICWLALMVTGHAGNRTLRYGPLHALAAFQLALTVLTAHGRTFGYL